MIDVGRRAFFRGQPRSKCQNRPPWALAENEFIDRCTRCGDCLSACPTAILVAGDGAYPTVNFAAGECTFCAECLTACRPGALHRNTDEQAAWPYKAAIGDNCLPRHGVECRICGDYCQPRAIRFTPRLGGSPLPSLDPESCTGCGACVGPCPAAAIRIG